MKQASESLQRAARRAGLSPVPIGPPRKPGRPQGARDRQRRVRLTAQASWELAMELMREKYEGLTMAGQIERQASIERRELSGKVLKNEELRHEASITAAGLRRAYRKGPKPAPMLLRKRRVV